jgi:chromosome segregation ATPase
MTEERTAETNGSRSFEERVFARFDGMDERFERIELRIEKLEMKQYDTKPIWEQALAAIAETNRVMAAGFDALRSEINASEGALRGEIATTNTRMDAGFDALRGEIATTNTRMDAGFDALRGEIATTNTRMDAGFGALRGEIATTNTRMDAGFEQLRTDFDFAWRSIERKIDVLNHNILDLQAEQRYVDSRLEKLESPPKPS